MVKCQQAWYFGVLLHLHKLLCSTVIFRLLHQLSPLFSWRRSGRCVLFPSGCVQLQINSCSDVHLLCSLPSSQNVSNSSPMQGLHMRLYTWWPRTVFHYELVTRGSGCTWSLCHVHFRFSPASCSLYWISEMSWQALIVPFIGHSWQILMNLYALKRTSSEATRSLNVRTTPLNND